MKVALDVNALYTTRAGLARHVRGLQGGLARVAPRDVVVEPVAWEVENHDYRQPRRAWRTFYREFVWGCVVAPRRLRRERFDLLHSHGGIVPPSLFPPQVATLCDLAVMRFPGRFRPWQRRSSLWRLRSLEKVRRVLCISRFTADEAHRLLGLPYGRMEVVPLGVDPLPPPDLLPGMPSGPFFVFVGSLEPGKNLALLRECYLRAESLGIVLPPLLIVGARWEGVAREKAPPASWRFLGFQPDSVLHGLYASAEALLFPSLYEGFGLPPLEAMQCGCPVLCGPVASLPEVCGDAACYAELAPAPYLEAMVRLLRDRDYRQSLVEPGRKRAASFTWDRCAAATVEVYRVALGA